MEVTVRPYRAEDRQAVREICYATGYMGDSPAWYWRDRRSFGDTWTRCYTDSEPESALVAEKDGEVAGYLLGCVDSRRAEDPVRAAVFHGVGRLCLLRPGTGRVMWRTLTDAMRDSVIGDTPLPVVPYDERFPSHLHIDMLERIRGTGAGQALMEAWTQRLRALGSPGCYLETLAENSRAKAFFSANGFTAAGEPVVVPGMRDRNGGRLHVQRMERSLV